MSFRYIKFASFLYLYLFAICLFVIAKYFVMSPAFWSWCLRGSFVKNFVFDSRFKRTDLSIRRIISFYIGVRVKYFSFSWSWTRIWFAIHILSWVDCYLYVFLKISLNILNFPIKLAVRNLSFFEFFALFIKKLIFCDTCSFNVNWLHMY